MNIQGASGDDMFKILMGGQIHQENIDYLKGQFSQLPQQLGELSQMFYMQAQSELQKNFSNEAMLYAQQIRSQFAQENMSAIGGIVIVDLCTMYAIQNASPVMQEYIMACPEIAQMHRAQTIDGYSATYVAPNVTYYYENPRYREVMDGVLVFKDDFDDEADADPDNIDYTYIEVADDYEQDGFTPLTFAESQSIQNTWRYALAHIAQGEEDPTSITGSSL